MNTKRLSLALILLILLAIVAIIVLTRTVPLAIGVQPGAVNYPMMFALDGGFFQKEGLNPETKIFRSANDAQDALLGNSIFLDAVIPIQNVAMVESERPGTLGILAILISDKQHPLDFLVVPVDSDIDDPQDLNDKTIVIFPGTYSETLTTLALEKIGVSGVKFLKLPPSEMPQAIQSGQADAGIVYEPTATLATTGGWGRILVSGFWEEYLLPTIVVGSYTYNAAAAKDRPAIVAKSYRAIKNALLAAAISPDDAKAPIAKYLGISQELAIKMPDSRVEMSDEIDPRLLDQILQFYLENGIIDEKVDLASLLYNPK